jgi:hypothetical protein
MPLCRRGVVEAQVNGLLPASAKKSLCVSQAAGDKNQQNDTR